uniref:Uncharacterized protein n=1 Tax=Bionectria ochroleuca TaxID=29856 RepID=A0A8H7NH73_BIOOC
MSDSSHPLSILVTGAAGGLGKTIATAYLDKGHNVTICDVHEERLDATSKLWTESYPGRFIIKKADVASQLEIDSLIEEIVKRFGRLDVLVNNAAVLDKFHPAGTCSQEMWDRILRVNSSLEHSFARKQLLTQCLLNLHQEDPLLTWAQMLLSVASMVDWPTWYRSMEFSLSPATPQPSTWRKTSLALCYNWEVWLLQTYRTR